MFSLLAFGICTVSIQKHVDLEKHIITLNVFMTLAFTRASGQHNECVGGKDGLCESKARVAWHRPGCAPRLRMDYRNLKSQNALCWRRL